MQIGAPLATTLTSSSDAMADIRPVASPNVVEHEIDDDLVLYDPRTDAVHVLNETAAAVWWLCDGQLTCREIATQIAKLYGKQLPDVEEDVLQALQMLLSTNAATKA